MQPLVRAPLNVAVQNRELIASWPTIACGQTWHVARAPVGVATSVTRCSRSDIPWFGVSSRRGVEFRPGGVLVVEGSVLEAAVEDADEPVGQLSEGGVVGDAAGADAVVVGAGAG